MLRIDTGGCSANLLLLFLDEFVCTRIMKCCLYFKYQVCSLSDDMIKFANMFFLCQGKDQ